MKTLTSLFVSRMALHGAILAFASLPLTAAIVTWNGDGGDALVSNGSNWVGGTAAASGSDLSFATETVNGLGGVLFDTGGTFNAPTVTFTATAPAYTLQAATGGDVLSITGSGTALINSSAFRQSSNLITIQVVTQTWDGGTKGLSISAIDLQNNRTLTLTGTGTGLNGNEITQKITGTGTSGIVKTGIGTLTFKNAQANDYTGATTVSGGTLVMNGSGNIGTGAFAVSGSSSILRLGLADQIANASAITLSVGGTFDLANKNETAGILTIGTGGGVIDLGVGAGNNIFTLADSHLASWTAPLQIKNFNTGDSLRFLGANGSGLTPSQLAGITFVNGSATNGSGTQYGAIDSNGFVTPTLAAVPEASTIAIGALVAFAGLSSRRRRRK